MAFHRMYYVMAIIILTFLYLAYFRLDGYRIQRYYSPDGEILPVGDMTQGRNAKKFFEIDGMDPLYAPTIFKNPDPVIVTTDTATGIMNKIENNPILLVFDFKYFIFYSYLFVILAIWFVKYGNDYHMAVLSMVIAGFHFTSFTSFAFHDFNFLWQVFSLAAIPAFLNMALRTTGKEIPGYLLLAELIFMVFLSLVSYVGKENTETYVKIVKATQYLFIGIIVFTALIQFENATKKTEDRIERLKRWSLVGGSIFGLLIPAILTFRSSHPMVDDPLLYPFLFSLTFPVGLVYGTYRVYMVPFQFTLSRSIVFALLTIFFAVIYAVVLLSHSILLPEQDHEHQWIVHIIFILILVFFLDPARRSLTIFLEKRVFRLNHTLTASLDRLANILASPNRIQSAFNAFVNELSVVLGVEQIMILFPDSTFPDLNLKQNRIIRISDTSRLWKHLGQDRVIVTSYLTYGAGSRGELYRFLIQNRIYMTVGITGIEENGERTKTIFKIKSWFDGTILRRTEKTRKAPARAAFLIGHRTDGSRFLLREIRYLQEAGRLASMLINNYLLLMRELENRRRIRQLVIAGEVQESMARTHDSGMENLEIVYFNFPVITVTGDYVDTIKLQDGETAIFFGDISGHGLGTGYLVSAVRSIVRFHLEKNADLETIMKNLNLFLLERYRGNEFATLFGAVISPATGQMTYVNAGHPAPIHLKVDGTINRLDSTAGLLGVTSFQFQTKQAHLLQGDRLFLYSDGVTETMNSQDHTFGLNRLESLIRKTGTGESLHKTIKHLNKELNRFRGKTPVHDDTSFMAIKFGSEEEIFERIRRIDEENEAVSS